MARRPLVLLALLALLATFHLQAVAQDQVAQDQGAQDQGTKPQATKSPQAAPQGAQPAKDEGQPPKAEEGDQPKESRPGVAVADQPRFVRVRRGDDNTPLALETAIATYVPAEGSPLAGRPVKVELVGAVHVGEAGYYKRLNEVFEGYESLLFELVAPEGTKIPKGGGERGGHPITMIQTGMKNMLGLEFQLEHVDYTKSNFVHADMTPEEFAQSMKDRGESVFKMLLRMMAQGMAAQGQKPLSDVELIVALFSKDRAMKLKRLMAEQMENVEQATAALNGPDGSSTIIGERNRKAMEVLRRELDAGKNRLGIFYGAAHLADMELRLERDFGLRRESIRWVPAWELK